MQIAAEHIAIAASALSLAWTVGLNIFVLNRDSDLETRRKIDGVLYDLNGLGKKVERLESRIDDMPGHDDLAKIYDEIRRVTADVSDVRERQAANGASLDSIHDTVSRIDNFLRQK